MKTSKWIVLLACLLVSISNASRALAQACVNNPNNLTYWGGPVLHNPRIRLILWGFGTPVNDPNGEIPFVTNVLSGSPGWHWVGSDTQYYSWQGFVTKFITNKPNQFVQTIIDNTRPLPPDQPPPSAACPMCTGPTLSAWRAAVGAEALAVSAGLDQADGALYVVLTPPRVNQPEQSNGAGAWHGSIAIPGTSRFLPYADIPYQTNAFFSYVPANVLNNTTSVVMHEVHEAITDPFYDQGQTAWSTNCGTENADFCGTFTSQKILPDFVTPNTVALPLIQSASANNGSGACVASYTKDSYRFYVDSYAGNPGYLYTSLGGSGCPLSGIWWDGVRLTGNVASVSWGPGRLDLFVLDINNHLQHLWSNDGGVTMFGGDDWGAGPSGYTLFGSPTVASWGPFHLDVFSLGRTLSGTTKLWHKMWNQNADGSVTITDWEDWGSPPTDTLYYSSGVTAVSDEPNRVDAFLVATNSNGSVTNLWQAWRMGSSGSPTWNNFGNPGPGVTLFGTPSVASWGAQRWDVFVGDLSSNRNLQHWFWDSSCCTGWDNWGTLPSGGGMSLADPSVIAMGDNRLHIYVQGNDTNIYKRTWDWGDKGWSSSLACSHPSGGTFSLRGTR